MEITGAPFSIRVGPKRTEWVGSRGVNSITAFQGPPDFTTTTMASRWATVDKAKIKTAGFDHVRLAFDPQAYATTAQRDLFFTAVDDILDQNLNVILCLLPSSSWRTGITSTGTNTAEGVGIFTDMAARVSAMPAATRYRVAFEVLNEPAITGEYWNYVGRAIAAIKDTCPMHTIMFPVQSSGGGVFRGESLPFVDYGVVASHYYGNGDDFTYTHQAASWISAGHGIIGNYGTTTVGVGLVFPRDTANCTAVLNAISASSFDSTAKSQATTLVNNYNSTNYVARKIGEYVASCRSWAKWAQMPVLCTEVGANQVGANPETWFSAVSDAFTDQLGLTFFEWSPGGGPFSVCDSSQAIKSTLTGVGMGDGGGKVPDYG